VWLLEELGIEYQIKKYQRTKEQLAPKQLEAVHPLGKSPIIVDNGHVIAESGPRRPFPPQATSTTHTQHCRCAQTC